MFDRVEVSIGGVQLAQGSNYTHVLNYARNAVLGKREDLLVGHGEMQRLNSYTESGAIGLVENALRLSLDASSASLTPTSS